jgi:hypothetical protein
LTADDLLAKLDGVRQTGRGRWLARCTGHEDKSPSLSIRELDDGRILLHCFAGCSVHEVVSGAGLQLQDLFPDKPQSADYVKGERRPFPAADVLRALADEAMIVYVTVANMAQGVHLSTNDYSRLLTAAARILEGRRLALGTS